MRQSSPGTNHTTTRDISLIRRVLQAGQRATCQALLATLLLLGGASTLAAQGTLGNPDSENLGGQGPGDMVVVQRGSTTYVEMLNFDAHQIVTYRLEPNNALTEVARTPTCDEPRQIAATQDNRWLGVACSNENTVRMYELPTDTPQHASDVTKDSIAGGVPTPAESIPTGGQQPFDLSFLCNDDILVVIHQGSGDVSFFEKVGFGRYVFSHKVSAQDAPHAMAAYCTEDDEEDDEDEDGLTLKLARKGVFPRSALIAVANSTSNDLTTYRLDDQGNPRLVAMSVPVGGSPRALAFDPSGRRLFVAVRSTPPAENQIRTYNVRPGGELTFVGSTPGGRFLTDIEATSDRVFVVTINNQNRDEIRTYRRRGNDLILDSALVTPSQPNFKQITVGPVQGNTTNVFVTEYQGGFMRSLTYTRDNQVACVGDAETLCLNGMELQVDFVASDNRGFGQAASLTSDTGYFWFFNRENIELVPKVLDARTVNGNFWVFYGALSNVAYNLRVTDTRTGRVREYGNPSGTLASVADTNAFPASDGSWKTASVAASDEELYALYLKRHSPQAPVSFAACAPGSALLCLTQNRFQVQVDWRVPSQGRSGSGTAVPVTGDTGYFWFFDSANVELIIKVLDARVINGKFWVFYGALSNVEYTITVLDTATGGQKTYVNPSGTLASIADTSAF